MPFEFDPCVGVRAAKLHVLHLLMPAYKVAFISTANFSMFRTIWFKPLNSPV